MDLTQIVNQGPLVAALVAVILYFYKRDKRNDRNLENATRKCEEREEKLRGEMIARDKVFSDHITNEQLASLELAHTCARALEMHAQALSKLTKIETDRFPVVKDKGGGHAAMDAR